MIYFYISTFFSQFLWFLTCFICFSISLILYLFFSTFLWFLIFFLNFSLIFFDVVPFFSIFFDSDLFFSICCCCIDRKESVVQPIDRSRGNNQSESCRWAGPVHVRNNCQHEVRLIDLIIHWRHRSIWTFLTFLVFLTFLAFLTFFCFGCFYGFFDIFVEILGFWFVFVEIFSFFKKFFYIFYLKKKLFGSLFWVFWMFLDIFCCRNCWHSNWSSSQWLQFIFGNFLVAHFSGWLK